jgi:two-component system, OmpR family, response regulator ChvI
LNSAKSGKSLPGTETRVFLVDDDQDIVFSITAALEESQEAFTVDSYTSPVVALENFRPEYYDLLLLDIRMPGMTGFELYENIQKLDKRVRVIFITAFEVYYEALREMFPDLVPTSFIQKPISNSNLVERIKRELKR